MVSHLVYFQRQGKGWELLQRESNRWTELRRIFRTNHRRLRIEAENMVYNGGMMTTNCTDKRENGIMVEN